MSKLPSKPTGYRSDQGFTLIELMVTVLILAILSTMALPSFQSFIANQRIKSTAFDIMAMITLTRSEAIKRNVLVTATPANNDWSKGWDITPSGGTAISQQSAQKGLVVQCFTAGSSTPAASCTAITYNSSGRINASNQSIQLSSSATPSVRCISIDLSGRPTSKKGNCP